eukprot:Rmarinus@m.28976
MSHPPTEANLPRREREKRKERRKRDAGPRNPEAALLGPDAPLRNTQGDDGDDNPVGPPRRVKPRLDPVTMWKLSMTTDDDKFAFKRGKCIGIWVPEKKLIHVTAIKGSVIQKFGFADSSGYYLHPEEAVYLSDRGNLNFYEHDKGKSTCPRCQEGTIEEILKRGVGSVNGCRYVTSARGQEILLECGVTYLDYAVFCYFASLGHPVWLLRSAEEFIDVTSSTSNSYLQHFRLRSLHASHVSSVRPTGDERKNPPYYVVICPTHVRSVSYMVCPRHQLVSHDERLRDETALKDHCDCTVLTTSDSSASQWVPEEAEILIPKTSGSEPEEVLPFWECPGCQRVEESSTQLHMTAPLMHHLVQLAGSSELILAFVDGQMEVSCLTLKDLTQAAVLQAENNKPRRR